MSGGDPPLARYERLVRSAGGTRVIRSVLIANNGMAATKFIISVRRWLHLSCGDSSLIKLIAMGTQDDIKANARHVSLADVLEEVPSGSNDHNYANVNLIISLAVKHGADAVWPGWGHASEKPALPRACKENGIAFIGPDEFAMFSLGDKVASTIIAQTARVPCVAWSGSGITLDAPSAPRSARGGGGLVHVPDSVFKSACVGSAEEAVAVADRVGFPVMIKASEGGGGKGVRKARDRGAIADMYRQVADEVKGSPIFLMRLCEGARHIEIQLVCDAHGNVAVLCGRDCSMQRRFQKIIEEGPPRAVPPETMAEMERAGMRLAQLVGYQNAGTVEFLFVEERNEFYFLELNPRLQVEHPVSEGITGCNIPSLQVLMASGADLTLLGDKVTKYIVSEASQGPGYNPFAKVHGHTIAARVTAENTADGWKPTVGAISSIAFQGLPDVWGYFSVSPTTSAVHQFADSQFGHVFAWGATRPEAIENMLLALEGLSIKGEVRNNVLILRQLVDSPDFKANRVDTTWLDSIIAGGTQPSAGPSEQTIAICGALMKAWRQIEATSRRISHEFIGRAAQPPMSLVQSLVELRTDFVCNKVQYRCEVYRHAPSVFSVAANGSLVQAKVYPMPEEGTFLVAYGDMKRAVTVRDEPGGALRLGINQHVAIIEKEKDPSLLTTAYTGKLTRFLVEDGGHVDKGAAFAEIEVMKMLCMITAPEAGCVSVERAAGSFVEAGEVIATMTLDDPSLVERPTPFSRELGDYAPLIDDGLASTGRSLSYQLGLLGARLESIFDGYLDNEEEVLGQLHEVLHDPELLQRELAEVVRRASADLPQHLTDQLAVLGSGGGPPSPLAGLGIYAGAGGAPLELGARVLQLVESHRAAAEEELRAKGLADGALAEALADFDAKVAPVVDFGQLYARGTRHRATLLVDDFVQRFLKVEALFSTTHTMSALLAAAENEPAKLVQVFLAHSQLERRSATLMSLIDIATTSHASPGGPRDDAGANDGNETRIAFLRPLATLEGIDYARIQSKAKQLLGTMTDDMAALMTKQLYPSLHRMASGAMGAAEEAAFTSYLQAHMHVAQALLFKAYAESSSGLRKAVARTLVQMWYGHCHVANVATKTYFRTGKEKSVITWEYDAAEGATAAGEEAPKNLGALVFFSSREDMETHFAWLCSCISGVEPGKQTRRAAASSAGGMARSLSNKALASAGSVNNMSAAAMPPVSPSASSLTHPGGAAASPDAPRRTLHVIIMADVAVEHKWKAKTRGPAQSSYDSFDDAGSAKYYQDFVKANAPALRALDTAQVAVTIPTPTRDSAMVEALMSMMVTPTYNFALPDYDEVAPWRHILPQFVQWLELERLSSFDIKHDTLPVHPLVHVFVGTAKQQAQDRRLFVRAVSIVGVDAQQQVARASRAGRSGDAPLSPSLSAADPGPFVAAESALTGPEATVGDETAPIAVLKALVDLVQPSLSASKSAHYSSIHVFLQHLQPLQLQVNAAMDAFTQALTTDLDLPDTSMLELEVRLAKAATVGAGGALAADTFEPPPPGALRVLARSSHVLQMSVYREAVTMDLDGRPSAPARLSLVASRPRADTASLDGAVATKPYALLSVVDQRRMRCHKAGTTYCYDLLELFASAVKGQWEALVAAGHCTAADVPAKLTEPTELALDRDGVLKPLAAPRPGGLNAVGMVAWRMVMRTPEYPEGREVVVIANDLSVQNGTFGPREDDVFRQASALARAERIPRLYIGANSGARFGLSEAVKSKFRVEWNDWQDPNKGIKYLYLTPKERESLGAAVVTEEVRVRVNKAQRAFQLGMPGGDFEAEDGAPFVEELHHKIVAIIGTEEGLGVECLQGSGMIAAETAIANREIFTIALSTSRNIGIGSYVLRLGQRIVQHAAAPIILTGHVALNKLLGNNVYESNLQLGGPEVMSNNGVSHAIVHSDLEGIAAIVKWLSYVPRTADSPPAALPAFDPVDRDVEFCPVEGEIYDPRCLIRGDGDKLGLFDVGSFTETLADWARTVVVGRARLGGIPVGVIATENRLVMKTVLADPANMESREEKVAQAGQVWFPDSAYKTAQAIHDFNHGERLPLIILANWRGFSGGRKDMFEEVLKFGSYIVENLTTYEQPVFVYIPPCAEVRGGAWVVIDTMINPRVMEMYADTTARGGVLEPAGIAEIKFRRAELVKTMHRLDPQLQWMKMNAAPGVVTKEDINQHEAELMPAYAPLGEMFADLHDRPDRMLAKGVIRKVVPWKGARTHFYWRLRRRLDEMPLQKRVEQRAPTLGAKEVAAIVHEALVAGAGVSREDVDDDKKVAECFERLEDVDALNQALDGITDTKLSASGSASG